MKTMLRLTLMIALLGSTMLAGDMGNGNQCPPEGCAPPPPPGCTIDCGGAAMGSGETESAGVSSATSPSSDSLDSIAIDVVEGVYLLFTF